MSTFRPQLVGSIESSALYTKGKPSINSIVEFVREKERVEHDLHTLSKEILSQMHEISLKLRLGDICGSNESISNILEKIRKGVTLCETDASGSYRAILSLAIEKFTEIRMYVLFFETGALVGLESVQPCSDEEYIGGAIGFAHQLSRYCLNRACEADSESISYCNEVVKKIFESLIQYEFRNSPLRKKFDSLKYVVKNLEKMLYELGMAKQMNDIMQTNKDREDATISDSECANKRHKNSHIYNFEHLDLIPVNQFTEIKVRLDAYDKLREDIIKQSRDIQKNAKQAIFAIHRSDFVDAKKKFVTAAAIIKVLLENVIVTNPTLRKGSFGNSIEELAEGFLLYEWLGSKRVLSKEEALKWILDLIDSDKIREFNVDLIMTDVEYIGALSDLTGELGRIAVIKATHRETASVKEILHTDISVAHMLTTINDNGKFNKKVEAVLTNMKKVDDLLYDLQLLSLSSGIRGASAPEVVAPHENENEE